MTVLIERCSYQTAGSTWPAVGSLAGTEFLVAWGHLVGSAPESTAHASVEWHHIVPFGAVTPSRSEIYHYFIEVKKKEHRCMCLQW